MSDDSFRLPLMLDGRSVSALVVGGGPVALRKTRSLLGAGARVRVISRTVVDDLTRMERDCSRLAITLGEYDAGVIGDSTLIVAATDDAAVNIAVARDARDRGRLVIVATAPEEGNCISPAVHRSGALVVAVSAGGVPGAAARVRDAIAARFDDRYAAAISALGKVRRHLLRDGDRSRWRQASRELTDEGFCESVEQGTLTERLAAWQ